MVHLFFKVSTNTIQFYSQSKIDLIEVHSADGKLMVEQPNGDIVQTRNWAKGTYYVRVTTGLSSSAFIIIKTE